MKKLRRKDMYQMAYSDVLDLVEKLQSELEALERRKGQSGMTEEVWEIAKRLYEAKMSFEPDEEAANGPAWQEAFHLAQAIQPLTVPQGFTPDWRKAPEWANCVSLYWARMHGSDRSFAGEAILFDAIPRPIPPKVTRERTVAELSQEWVDEQYHSKEMEEERAWKELAIELANGKSLKDLCTAAGIPLTEEV